MTQVPSITERKSQITEFLYQFNLSVPGGQVRKYHKLLPETLVNLGYNETTVLGHWQTALWSDSNRIGGRRWTSRD